MEKEIVFRVNAGKNIGLGHLSRCLSLAESFPGKTNIHFLIKTEDSDFILSYINRRKICIDLKTIDFIPVDIKQSVELKMMRNLIKKLGAFLIIDHYEANLEYQMYLKNNQIRWLQFDSHAKQILLSNFILHASPSATPDVYRPLIKDDNSILLLGTKFTIVNKNFLKKRKLANIRQNVKNVFICFSGGKDCGAMLYVISNLDYNKFEGIVFHLFINQTHEDFHKLETIANSNAQIRLYINNTDIAHYMVKCDIGIIAPGTLSYEAACVGMPMILITLADNQRMNAEGWQKVNCSKSLGEFSKLSKRKLNNTLHDLVVNPKLVHTMSENCFNNVDGFGAERVVKAINITNNII